MLPLFGAGNVELSLWLGMVQSCHLRIALHNDGRTRVEARQCGDFSVTTLAGQTLMSLVEDLGNKKYLQPGSGYLVCSMS